METFALTLLILLSPGDEPLATSIAAATRATIGAQVVLELRFVAVPPDDAAAVALAQESQAAALALLTWSDESRQRAQLRVYAQTTARWVMRELEFAADDPPDEKGRTIGFNFGSMLPETSREPPAPAKPPPVAPAAANPPASPPVATPAPSAAPTPPWRFAVDAVAQGVVAIGGEGTSAGGSLGGRYRLSEHFALCAAVALRLGHSETLEARMVAIDVGPGVAWRSADAAVSNPWGLQLRIDAFARVLNLQREPDGAMPAESHGRVVPGVGVGAELTFALNADVALVANTNAYVLLSETDVFLRGQQVAAFAPVELVLGLGARVHF